MTTISTLTNKRIGPGDGATTTFSFTIAVLDKTYVNLSLIDRATGAPTAYMQGSGANQYLVTIAKDYNSFSIVLGSGLAALFNSAKDLLVERVTPKTQPQVVPYDNTLPPKTQERMFDRTIHILQEQANLLGLGLTLPTALSGLFNPLLPAVIPPRRALVSNAAGTAFVMSTYDPDTTGDAAAAAAASATAAQGFRDGAATAAGVANGAKLDAQAAAVAAQAVVAMGARVVETPVILGAASAFFGPLTTNPINANLVDPYVDGVIQHGKGRLSMNGDVTPAGACDANGLDPNGKRWWVWTAGNVPVAGQEVYVAYMLGYGSATLTSPAAGSVGYASMTLADLATTAAEFVGNKLATAAGVISAINGARSKFIVVEHQLPAGTNGGTFTAGGWVARLLNIIVTNEVGGAVSVDSSTGNVQIPAGTYRCRGYSHAYYVNNHRIILRNVNDGSVILTGMSHKADSSSTNGIAEIAILEGQFTITVDRIVRIEHRCLSTRANDGLGQPFNVGLPEVFGRLVLEKIA